MTLGELVPWGRKDRNLALQDRDTGWPTYEASPFLRLHQEVNRLFDDVFRGFGAPGAWTGQWPTLEVEETGNGYRVSADLPGLDEKDVEVSIADGVLTIRGEKRAETEDRNRRASERYYGHFERQVAIGDVDEEKATATFRRGVLTIELPRSAQAQDRVRRIPIHGDTKH